MAVLNLLSASLAVEAPSGMWEFFLRVFDFIANYGWRIILFTVILKLLLSPLDFYQKYKMKKNQRITKNLEPEMERLQKQYSNDKQSLQREQMKLQRSMGFSYFSSCIPMIITLVVFFTFFAGMRNISQYEEFKQYVELYGVYSTQYTALTDIKMPGVVVVEDYVYDDTEFNTLIMQRHENDPDFFVKNNRNAYGIFEENGKSFKELYSKKLKYDKYFSDLDSFKNSALTVEQKQAAVNELNENEKYAGLLVDMERAGYDNFEQVETDYNKVGNMLNELDFAAGEDGLLLVIAKQSCSKAVADYYDNHNNSFLWIKSLWVADAPWGEPIPNFDTFSNNVSKYINDNEGKLAGNVLNELKRESTYNNVMGDIRAKDSASKPNGYLILAILAIAFSLLSQFITTRQQKKSGQVGTQGGAMKMMMFIMPAMTGVFAILYTSSFAIYMITNSIMSLAINLLSTAILGGINRIKSNEERSDTGIVKYGRKDPNDYRKK